MSVEDGDETTLDVSDSESHCEEEGRRQTLVGPKCPLCRIDDVSVETASMVLSSSCNNFIRKIMAYELVKYGAVPDKVIYSNIAHTYNKSIQKQMRNAGVPCERWTPSMVEIHFEHHVSLVPRRLLGNDLRRLEALSKLVDREIEAGVERAQETFGIGGSSDFLVDGEEPPQVATELVDNKLIKKQLDIIKAKFAVLRDYRNYQKEDMVASGVNTLWKSVELGETSAAEAKKLLEQAAMVQTAAGAADLPNASELFD